MNDTAEKLEENIEDRQIKQLRNDENFEVEIVDDRPRRR